MKRARPGAAVGAHDDVGGTFLARDVADRLVGGADSAQPAGRHALLAQSLGADRETLLRPPSLALVDPFHVGHAERGLTVQRALDGHVEQQQFGAKDRASRAACRSAWSASSEKSVG
jgi:hypothetical protein